MLEATIRPVLQRRATRTSETDFAPPCVWKTQLAGAFNRPFIVVAQKVHPGFFNVPDGYPRMLPTQMISVGFASRMRFLIVFAAKRRPLAAPGTPSGEDCT